MGNVELKTRTIHYIYCFSYSCFQSYTESLKIKSSCLCHVCLAHGRTPEPSVNSKTCAQREHPPSTLSCCSPAYLFSFFLSACNCAFSSLCPAIHLRQMPHTRLTLSKLSSLFVLRSLRPKRTRQKVERNLRPQRARLKQKAKRHHSPSNHQKKTISTFFQSYSRYMDMSNTPR